MMLKLFPLTALVLGLSGGVALADRGDHRGVAVEHRGVAVERRGAPTVVRDHREFHNNAIVARDRGNWRGDGRVGGWRGDGRVGGWRGDGRVVVHAGPAYRHIDRRPIYVSRPIIRERYFNYYRRPALFVENYNTMPGYYWVAGNWVWNGAEWIWQPGHYQPDPNYVDQGYDQGYDDSY